VEQDEAAAVIAPIRQGAEADLTQRLEGSLEGSALNLEGSALKAAPRSVGARVAARRW
jgi:hypothetical protein